MPSPRSQPSHTARYPTATHHPSKSGSIRVSQVTQCDVMLSTSPHPAWPQSPPDACMVGQMHGILFLFVVCPPSDFVVFRLETFILTMQWLFNVRFLVYWVYRHMVIFMSLDQTGIPTDHLWCCVPVLVEWSNIFAVVKICDPPSDWTSVHEITAVCCVCFCS